MKIVETERLVLRELDSATDAEFVFALLNTPTFIKFIGDRGVRSSREAAAFIEERYRASYRDHGFGLYVVELKGIEGNALTDVPASATKSTLSAIGLCGFVKRDTLPGPDIGFAFLPEFERQGYGFESAEAMMEYGRKTLGFTNVLAITSLENDISGKLLEKLGFKFDKLIESGDETLKLYSSEL